MESGSFHVKNMSFLKLISKVGQAEADFFGEVNRRFEDVNQPLSIVMRYNNARTGQQRTTPRRRANDADEPDR